MIENGTTYKDWTSDKVIAVLESVRASHERVRVYYGDTQTGKSWGEEFGTMGYVGRSAGRVKIPLLIYNRRSMGGGALLDGCIIKIVRTSDNRVLYAHPEFHTARYEIGNSGYWESPVAVYADGQNVANFRTGAQARRWSAFMEGRRNAK